MAGCAKSTTEPRSAPPKAKDESPAPPRELSPRVGREEETRLREEAEAKIQGTEHMVERINQRTLAKDQREILSTIHSFLTKAKEALSIKDFSRAYNLANKAFILAQELSGTP